MTTDETSARFRQAAQLTDTVRETMALVMTVAVDGEELDGLRLALQAVNERLRAASGERPFPAWHQEAPALNERLPYSPVTGPLNPVAPPVPMRTEGGGLAATVSLSALYEGPPGCVHGAVIAGVYDQLLAMANALNGTHGPTGRLTVSYRKPTPLHRPLEFRSRIRRIDGRKVYVTGTCHDGDDLLTECEGLFIQYDRTKSSWRPSDRQFD